MRTISEQKEKIRNLKEGIKKTTEEMSDIVASLDVEKEMKLTPEEQAANKKAFGDAIALKRANITALKAELKTARLNKNGSSFFEYTPHTGMNRRQARQFRRMRAQGLIKTPKKNEKYTRVDSSPTSSDQD